MSSSINGSLSDHCVVALSTGTKCVTGKVATLPDVIVDCHAESLLKRAFKRYMIACMAKNQATPLHLEGRKYHLFISQLPCGTIERYKGAQDNSCSIGIRKKPGRGEVCAKPSCVDKLAKWVRFGFQGRKLIALTKKRIDIASIHIGNCVQQEEFTHDRLKSALVECESPESDEESPKAKRQKTTTHEKASSSHQQLFPERVDIDIVFSEDFRQDELTRSESRKACPSAIVAWKENDSMMKEVVVLGRKLGSTKKSKNHLLISDGKIATDVDALHQEVDKNISQCYHDAWQTMITNCSRFRGWPSSPLTN